MLNAQPVRSPAQVALAFHPPGVLWQVSDFTRRWGFESQSVCTLYLHTRAKLRWRMSTIARPHPRGSKATTPSRPPASHHLALSSGGVHEMSNACLGRP